MALCVDIRKKMGSFQLEIQFEAGNEALALLGASGCGKSTALKCIAGILTPDQGKISLDGAVLFDSAAGVNLPPQKRRVGYLFQQYALFPNMTVRQNIAAAVPKRRERTAAADILLHRFHLAEAAGLKPRQLSGGQQQRTALARILAARPRAILLDEPLSALDSFLQRQLELELAETLDQFSGTVLWVSHNRGEAFRNCRRVCVLDNGRSQKIRTMEELFRSPDTEAAARLCGCENYVEAIPIESAVFLPEWGVTLDCGRPVPAEICKAGIRAHHVTIAGSTSPGAFPCAVSRVIQDLSSTVVLLRPENSLPGAPPLRMELDQTAWSTAEDKDHIWISIRPEDLLLLK